MCVVRGVERVHVEKQLLQRAKTRPALWTPLCRRRALLLRPLRLQDRTPIEAQSLIRKPRALSSSTRRNQAQVLVLQFPRVVGRRTVTWPAVRRSAASAAARTAGGASGRGGAGGVASFGRAAAAAEARGLASAPDEAPLGALPPLVRPSALRMTAVKELCGCCLTASRAHKIVKATPGCEAGWQIPSRAH